MQDTHSLKMMGTVIDIMIESEKPNQHIEKVIQLLNVYKNRFSANDDDSELAQINQYAGVQPVTVHPDLFELVAIGKKNSIEKPSNLNIAIGPLVQSWRIGFDDATVPDSSQIKEALKLSNPAEIILDSANQAVFLSQKGMKIDLGALAKGYIADKVIAYLKSEKVQSAMINLGGNVLITGDNPKRDNGIWNIGIQHPQKKRGENIGILKISDKSVVTSGIYERHLRVGNKDYHHIFDQKTGYPIETDLASLTIVSKHSLDCEIWTSRLFGLPLVDIIMTINATPYIEGILITRDKRIAVTDGLKKDFKLLYRS